MAYEHKQWSSSWIGNDPLRGCDFQRLCKSRLTNFAVRGALKPFGNRELAGQEELPCAT